MTEQIKEPLPESLMKAIKASVESPDLTAEEKFAAAVLIAHGYGLYLAQERLNPTAYAIPEEQWTAICGMLQTTKTGDIAQVNVGMDWMNVGPSGYKE